MADRLEFRSKLGSIQELAAGQGNRLTVEEIEKFFEEDGLSREQTELVCDYLLSQKVSVTGYKRQPGKIIEAEEEPADLDSEEQDYLAEYMQDIESMKGGTIEEARMAYYLPLVADTALQMHQKEVFIGDTIQEGNISLVTALSRCEAGTDDEDTVMEEVRAGIRAFIESQTETKRQDKKMVNQVAELDETIRHMSEDMGRKVSVDEVAQQLGTTEEQIEAILKLAGEEAREDK
ncbi:RNA polymerase sigma factor region1.1 domain-containing protein [Dorea sp. D27]|uniref:RNA polymerase sigma factor region1.1 domain-containing protein n=1 Tax=Dorea sp. D27 TaxID=658665 RepID=UPI000673BC5F|nr:RNA polymerase sigma factor region1.1 domain-containing protein [Dorea sp. D27]KMZ53944.1 putative RpoD protein [Dorea sp. D27]